MANDKILELTNDNFEGELANSETPILVDFWAAWCGPCRVVAPVLEELANEMDGQVKIAKVNIDDHRELANRFDVSSIPTFILFKDGEVKDRMMGSMPKSAFQKFISSHV